METLGNTSNSFLNYTYVTFIQLSRGLHFSSLTSSLMFTGNYFIEFMYSFHWTYAWQNIVKSCIFSQCWPRQNVLNLQPSLWLACDFLAPYFERTCHRQRCNYLGWCRVSWSSKAGINQYIKNADDDWETFLPSGIREETEELIYTLTNRKSAHCSQKKKTSCVLSKMLQQYFWPPEELQLLNGGWKPVVKIIG